MLRDNPIQGRRGAFYTCGRINRPDALVTSASSGTIVPLPQTFRPTAMKFAPTLYFCSLCLLLLAVPGCQQRAGNTLQGRWVGRPDTAAMRANREAEKYGDERPQQPTSKLATKLSDDEADDDEYVTDWEKYDVTITMDFVSSDQIEMTLDGGQPVRGSWKVLSTSPTGCTIEVTTEATDSQQAEPQETRRRFELLFDEREGVCVGFQLSEAGADAQLGALYFARPADASAPPQN